MYDPQIPFLLLKQGLGCKQVLVVAVHVYTLFFKIQLSAQSPYLFIHVTEGISKVNIISSLIS